MKHQKRKRTRFGADVALNLMDAGAAGHAGDAQETALRVRSRDALLRARARSSGDAGRRVRPIAGHERGSDRGVLRRGRGRRALCDAAVSCSCCGRAYAHTEQRVAVLPAVAAVLVVRREVDKRQPHVARCCARARLVRSVGERARCREGWRDAH